jgi:hypothetical protein
MTHGKAPIGIGLAQRLLAALTDREQAEILLGDVLEALAGSEAAASPASLQFWMEVGSVLPALLAARLRRDKTMREGTSTMDTWTTGMRRAAAWLGLIACLPAMVLIGGGFLQMFFGTPEVIRVLDNTIHNESLAVFRVLRHPATILLGLALAGVLNLLPLLRLGLSRQSGTLVGTIALRTRRSHLAVGSLAGLLLIVILGYAFTENFEVTPRHSLTNAAQTEMDLGAELQSEESQVYASVYDPCPPTVLAVRSDADSSGDPAQTGTVLVYTANADCTQ